VDSFGSVVESAVSVVDSGNSVVLGLISISVVFISSFSENSELKVVVDSGNSVVLGINSVVVDSCNPVEL